MPAVTSWKSASATPFERKRGSQCEIAVSTRASRAMSSRALGRALPEHVVAELLAVGAHRGQRGKLVVEDLVGMRSLMLRERAPVGDDCVVVVGRPHGGKRSLVGDEAGELE